MNPATKMKRWRLKTGDIDIWVDAKDSFSAYDQLRDYPANDFGLVVDATPAGANEDGSFPIRTSLLMTRWFRDEDAQAFVALGISTGMPDTTDADFASCGRER